MKYAMTVFCLGLMCATAVLADDDDAPAVATQSVRAEVKTVALRQQQLRELLTAYGQVTQDSRQVTTLSVPRAGQLTALAVRVGQRVHKGQLLLTFSDSAEAGQAWQQAQLAVDFAQGERARMAQMLALHLATAGQLAAADKALADAQADLHAQQALGAGQGTTRIVAPFDGWVSALPVSVGDRTAAGAALLQLSPVASVQVVLALVIADGARVRPGMPVNVTSLVRQAVVQQGQVSWVAGAANGQTQQVEIGVSVPAGVLMPGERVSGEIVLRQQLAWVVPRLAVLADAAGAYLYQVKAGQAVRVAVRAGLEDAQMREVSGAFLPGAPVVTEGNYELQPGMAVHVLAATPASVPGAARP